MSPPLGLMGKNSGNSALPPENCYSPNVCANCHTSPGPNETYRSKADAKECETPNARHSNFRRSPSDCSAEIFWPDFLKVQRDFRLQPSRIEQNRLTTLLKSRQGQFPFEVQDASLQAYLGMQGPVSFQDIGMPFNLLLPHDGKVCLGQADLEKTSACEGLQLDLQNGDVGLLLTDSPLLVAEQLEVSGDGWAKIFPGAKLSHVSVREGRLLVSFFLSNPLWNAGFAGFAEKIPLPIRPNPDDPTRYDADLTEWILKKLPVAYDPQSKTGYNLSEYQSHRAKSRLSVIPYFLSLAGEGKLPDRLSLHRLFEAVISAKQNIAAPSKKHEPQVELFFKNLLETLVIKTHIGSGRFMRDGIYVQFDAAAADRNQLETRFSKTHPNQWSLATTIPLQLSQLFSPGIIDIASLSTDLSLKAEGDWSEFSPLKLSSLHLESHHLDLAFGITEYLRSESHKTGIFALLGGRLRSLGELDDALLEKPDLKISGNVTDGFEVSLGLKLENVTGRLPFLGQVTLVGGEIRAKAKIRADFDMSQPTLGKIADAVRFTLEPGSLSIQLDDLEMKTQGGTRISGAALEISNQSSIPYDPKLVSSFQVRMNLPNIEGGDLSSMELEGEIVFPKKPEDARATQALGQVFIGDWRVKTQRKYGDQTTWGFNFNGAHRPDWTDLKIALDSSAFNAKGAAGSPPVQKLKLHLARSVLHGKTHYRINAQAAALALEGLQLRTPKLAFSLTQEALSAQTVRYSVPKLAFQATREIPARRDSKHLLLHAPIYLISQSNAKQPWTFIVSEQKRMVEMTDLDLRFNLPGIARDKLRALSKGKIMGVDVDGNIEGHFRLNYDTFHGEGEVMLRGDPQGDVHLLDSGGNHFVEPHPLDSGKLVTAPLFSNTQLRLTRIRGARNDCINGNFRLVTDIDPAVARVFNIIVDPGKVIELELSRDHLCYTAAGFAKKMEEYLRAQAGGQQP